MDRWRKHDPPYPPPPPPPPPQQTPQAGPILPFPPTSIPYQFTAGMPAPNHHHLPRPFMDGVRHDSPAPAPAPVPVPDPALFTSDSPDFDILDWFPAYQSCVRYFLDHAQHEPATQALCALINIRLPYAWVPHPVVASQPGQSPSAGGQPGGPPGGGYAFGQYGARGGPAGLPALHRPRTDSPGAPPSVSLVPYLRRLVVTAFDKPPILHGFFGDDYVKGILPHLDCERRNYLFAAKHGGWRTCKRQYDIGSGYGGDETVPFMKPLDEARLEELTAAEKAWSAWLAMEDWMVGPRAPAATEEGGSANSSQGMGREHSNGRSGGGFGQQQQMQMHGQMPDGVGEVFERQ